MWELFDEDLRLGCSGIGVMLGERQVSLMRQHAQDVKAYNERVNLTDITDERQMALKHYVDSLACARFVPHGASLVDVGTGGGYPGIPLLIARPDIHLTLVDAIQKRTLFLRDVLQRLGLAASVVHARTEDFGREAGREKFDCAVARAVARTNVLAEFCLPLVRVGGLFVAMKGPSSDPEIAEAAAGVRILGGEIEQVHDFELPQNAGRRRLVLIRKASSTPGKYPRRAGVPERKPL